MEPRLLKLVLAFAVAACAASTLRGPTRQPAPAPDSLPPLPRSSIAAVLEHREELKLTAEQIQLLEEHDEKLAARNAAVRGGTAPQTQRQPNPDAGPPSASPSRPAQQGGLTAGRGAGGPGGGMGGGSRGAPRRRAPSEASRNADDLERRLDDNDTRAYLEAEQRVLTPEQRERARDIAEEYREKLYDRRELLGRRGDGSP